MYAGGCYDWISLEIPFVIIELCRKKNRTLMFYASTVIDKYLGHTRIVSRVYSNQFPFYCSNVF